MKFLSADVYGRNYKHLIFIYISDWDSSSAYNGPSGKQ